MYTLLAARRGRVPGTTLRNRFLSVRGVVRGVAMGVAGVNTVAGMYVYGTGDRKAEEEERREVNRWGVYRD